MTMATNVLPLKCQAKLKQAPVIFFIFLRKEGMTYHVNHLLGRGESGVSDKYFSYFSVQTYIVNDH